ncbi:hypothetical protein, partial [Planotetraspora thailandica]|uniref:hypothetical protein n=1 Tax=Planotetraspora thailandica TaxID=487172 RepID=UPI00194E4850
MADRRRRPSPASGEPIGGAEWWAEVREQARAWSSDGSSALSSPSGIKAWWEATLAENASTSSAPSDFVPSETTARLASVGCGEPPADDAAELAQEASPEPPPSPKNGTESATEGPTDLVAMLVDAASALALVEPPEVASACLAEAQELIYARDRLVSAI